MQMEQIEVVVKGTKTIEEFKRVKASMEERARRLPGKMLAW